MANKQASVSLSLNPSGYIQGMRRAKAEGATAARETGSAFKAAMQLAGSSIKSSLGGAFTFAKGALSSLTGGIGLMDLARSAVQVEGRYRKLAFAMRAGGDATANWKSLMGQARDVAMRTGQSTDELAEAFSVLQQATGDSTFAKESIEAIATAATASQHSITDLAGVAGTLYEKFGATSKEMPDLMASVLSLGNKGGVSVEELSEKLSVVGASARAAGLGGKEGFGNVVGMLNVADDTGRNLKKNLTAVSGVIDTLGRKGSREGVLKKLGFNPAEIAKTKGDAISTLDAIIKKTGGSGDKLAKAFGAEEVMFIEGLAQKAKTEADGLQGALRRAGQSALSSSQVRTEADAQMSTAAGQAKLALERLKASFSDERVTKAINQFAAALPPAAEALGKLVDWALEHPAAAGVAGAAALAAPSAAGGVVSGVGARLVGGAGAGVAAGSGAMGALAVGAGVGSALIGGELRTAYNRRVAAERESALSDIDRAGLETGVPMIEESAGGAGSDVRARAYRFYDRDAEGRWTTKTSRTAKAFSSGLAGRFQPPPEEYGRREEFGERVRTPNEQRMRDIRMATPPSQDRGLYNEMMGVRQAVSKELRVRITNLHELKGPPAPGHERRED